MEQVIDHAYVLGNHQHEGFCTLGFGSLHDRMDTIEFCLSAQ
jgi:hypothetical protein